MYNFSNSTNFGIKNDTERYLWVGWLAFVVVSSLLGDSLILIASIKYKAFKLHEMTVTFIQHIAVNDLLASLGCVAPAMLSATFNTGSPNRFIDYLKSFVLYYTPPASSVLISSLTLGKLLLLKYPLHLRSFSKRNVHKLCLGIWAICATVPVLHLGIDKDDVMFDYRTYLSSHRYSSSTWKILMLPLVLIFLIAPGVTIVVSTVLILKEARKVVRRNRENLRWQGITTVVLTATVYVTAFFPLTIYFIFEPFVVKTPGKPSLFHSKFYRVAKGVLQFSVLSNFFIYSLTVTSFRRFLVAKFYEIFSGCSKTFRGNAVC